MDTGVARKPIEDMDAYRASLAQRLDPSAAFLQKVSSKVQREPKTIVFAEGEELAVIRAANAFQAQGFGKAILCGREELVHANMRQAGLDPAASKLEIINARVSHRNAEYVDYLYRRLQRKGLLLRDVQRLINLDRNAFASCMVALGHADGMVTGVTRNFSVALEDVRKVIDPKPGHRVIGVSLEELLRVDVRICVAGGFDKVPAILAALRRGCRQGCAKVPGTVMHRHNSAQPWPHAAARMGVAGESDCAAG